jgi:uncharacterized flavoprotein (TIGR03862 family)
MSQQVMVIGGGPAGLMAAEILLQRGLGVSLYEANPAPGRKFLVAGKGGLNLTHAEPREIFLSRYGMHRPQIEPLLDAFGPNELREWAHGLGIETYIGSSGRVFPKEMNTAPLLNAWLERLETSGLQIYPRHKWVGWGKDRALHFETPDGEIYVNSDAVILALGGGSRPELGSNGRWIPLLAEYKVDIAPLKPANCGFDVEWTTFFREKFEGTPVKSVAITFNGQRILGEFIITQNGVEGSLIYTISAQLRDEIEAAGQAVIELDLTTDWTEREVTQKLSQPRGSHSISKHLKRTLNISGVKSGLLWEFVNREDFSDPERLACAIKSLPIPLIKPRPLEEAISSAGGVTFESLDEHLMLRALPGVFCAGEMLDWEAPTGGYLLTACFASGYSAGLGVVDWLDQNP